VCLWQPQTILYNENFQIYGTTDPCPLMEPSRFQVQTSLTFQTDFWWHSIKWCDTKFIAVVINSLKLMWAQFWCSHGTISCIWNACVSKMHISATVCKIKTKQEWFVEEALIQQQCGNEVLGQQHQKVTDQSSWHF